MGAVSHSNPFEGSMRWSLNLDTKSYSKGRS